MTTEAHAGSQPSFEKGNSHYLPLTGVKSSNGGPVIWQKVRGDIFEGLQAVPVFCDNQVFDISSVKFFPLSYSLCGLHSAYSLEPHDSKCFLKVPKTHLPKCRFLWSFYCNSPQKGTRRK